MTDPTQIAGVRLRQLVVHADARGSLAEVFRQEWETGIEPVQWNINHSTPNVLRGVHVHPRHVDYLIVVQGRVSIGLRDLRPGSPSAGVAALVELRGDRPTTLTIPPGVAHGFLFHEPTIHLYGVSHYWDSADELGCHWADPALEIPWPVSEAILSDRDAGAPPLASILGQIPPYQPDAG